MYQGSLQFTYVGADIVSYEDGHIFRKMDIVDFCFLLQDGNSSLQVRRVDICHQSPLKPRNQSFFQSFKFPRRAIAGHGDLLAVLV